MKTNSRGVDESRSREAEPGSQAVGCRLLVTLRLSTLDSQLLGKQTVEKLGSQEVEEL
jgi:hypothetical protein